MGLSHATPRSVPPTIADVIRTTPPDSIGMGGNPTPPRGTIGNVDMYGEVVFPVVGFDPTAIQSGLGAPRDGGSRQHQGVDIFAPEGTSVVAAVTGTVVKIDREDKGGNDLGGLTVAIVDRFGNRHYYAHLSWIPSDLKDGDVVGQGGLIGRVGQTGNARTTPPHLHYSVNEGRTGKNLLDPAELFSNGRVTHVDPNNIPDAGEQQTGDGGFGLSVDAREDLTPEQAIEIARDEFPLMLAFLANPELQPIFIEAVQEGWGSGKLQSALEQTEWWQGRTTNQREIEGIKATDPGTWEDVMDQAITALGQVYSQLGITPEGGPEVLKYLAEQFIFEYGNIADGQLTFDERRMMIDILGDVAFDPTDVTPSGTLGETMVAVKELGAQYLMKVSDKNAFDWAKDIISGAKTEDAVRDIFRDQAISRFSNDPHMTQRISEGFTPAQLLSGLQNEIADVLELSDPTQIDWRNAKWKDFLDVVDAEGNHRAMTISEARLAARQMPEANNTAAKKRDSRAVTSSILDLFGLEI